MDTMFSDAGVKALAQAITDDPGPLTYTHHVNYIDFRPLNMPQPIYINMIREPVDRVISWFYYIRASWFIAQKAREYPENPLPKLSFVKRSFEECFLSNDKECDFNQDSSKLRQYANRQMAFFCGHDREKCYPFNSLTTLQIAKANVEESYAVVGSWEDTNVTLTVLEHYIPRFFKGALSVFKMLKKQLLDAHRNSLKPQISPEFKNMVRKNFSNEIEFYNFCKQRLYKQYLAIKLGYD